MAGLSAAIKLASQGFSVIVVEKEQSVGGKARKVTVDGIAVDGGPTVLTMKWAFDQLLSPIGESLEGRIRLREADVLARHYWKDGSSLDLFADVEKSADAIRDFSNSRNAMGYRRFCDDSRAVYATLKDTYINAQRPNPVDLISRIGALNVRQMLQLKPLDSLWRTLGHYFSDPRLRQLFGRYATYCGSSPFKCPATLMLVAHVEQDGVWIPEGGMHGVACALREIAEELGVRFLTGQSVSTLDVSNGTVCGVHLDGGDRITCESVVFNGDVSAIADGKLGLSEREIGFTATAPGKRSLSALVWSALIPANELPLAHHSVCFGNEYRNEFDAVFSGGAVPTDPTVYLCAQDRDCDGVVHLDARARGTERVLILVNAPASGDLDTDHFTNTEMERCQSAMFQQLNQCGLTLRPEQITARLATPVTFNRLFPGTGGALYGRANHGPMASFQRQGARTKVRGLYLAGGSVHPGPGVPMAVISGQLAADCLVQDHALTR